MAKPSTNPTLLKHLRRFYFQTPGINLKRASEMFNLSYSFVSKVAAKENWLGIKFISDKIGELVTKKQANRTLLRLEIIPKFIRFLELAKVEFSLNTETVNALVFELRKRVLHND